MNFVLNVNSVFSEVVVTPQYSNSTLKLTAFNAKGSINLACNVITNAGDKIDSVKWARNNTNIDQIASLKDRYSTNYNSKDGVASLKILKSTDDDAGNYTCIAISNGVEYEATIFTISDIRVKVSDNINVVEGEKLRIVCAIVGNPLPEITWKVLNNKTYTESEDRIILQKDERDIPNAVFIINEVQMSDRGEYVCLAYSNLTGSRVDSTSMIRIKDKYAALWPFLGICAEVFVLCAIILIYEKKRNKTELEESDTDQSPDQKNTPDHGKEANLRHRQ